MKSGLDYEVQEFLESQPLAGELYRDICAYLDAWLPRYRDSNRSYMTVALGCTGGQHRSVYLADRLFHHYQARHHNPHRPRIHLRLASHSSMAIYHHIQMVDSSYICIDIP